ncbi:MAG: MFS transporter [Candidatus Rokubacteria bacterium]|nr:MFS transporter [Candidatus Rokubacteria bacterium]
MIPVLAAAFLFNLGQGVLRPTLPLYLHTVFAANYRMVTLIPTVFGAGKWIASLPTGYLADRVGRRALMVTGLAVIAVVDVVSASTSTFGAFIGLRALGGVGWAMFGTVALTTMVDREAGRGRAVSLLLLSETAGLLLGNATGGWLYQAIGIVTPFVFEAACMAVAAVVVALWIAPPPPAAPAPAGDGPSLRAALRIPGVLVTSVTNGVMVATQTGVLVFLLPLLFASRAGLQPDRVGVLVSLTVLGRLPALWLGGMLSDRWGRVRVLVPGLVLYAGLLGSVTSLRRPLALGVWSLAIGSAIGLVTPLPTALVGDLVSPEARGVAIGWLRTMTDTGHVGGPLAMGALADAGGLSAPFVVASGLLVLMAWLCRRRVPAVSAAGDRSTR